MASHDDINTPLVAVVGFIGTMLVFVVVVLLMVIYYHTVATETAEKDQSAAPAELTRLVSGQEAELADYRMLDAEKKLVALPIKRAMELTVAELSKPAAPPQKAAGGGP